MRQEVIALVQTFNATVVLTSNGFEILGVFDGDPDVNNSVLWALPH